MDMLNRFDFRAHRRDAAPRLYCVTRVFSICYVAVFGGVFAFSMLSFGLARASAPREALSIWHAQTTNPVLPVIVALVALTTVALGGWFRMRAALQRALGKARGAESEWQRRYADVEAREQAFRAVAAAQVTAVSGEERDRLHASMRHLASGPLCALAGMLDVLNSASLPPSQRSLVARIHSAARTLSRALEDMFVPSEVDSSPIALDESSTDLRELVDGVVALFSPAAVRKHAYLSVSIDRLVASHVLADSARLGQIVFHLLSCAVRSTEHGQITVTVRAEPINSGSQRVHISVRTRGAHEENKRIHPTQAQRRPSFDRDGTIDTSHINDDPYLTLCRQLAQHMRGELRFKPETGLGTCSTFSVPVAIEHSFASTSPKHFGGEPSQQPSGGRPVEDLGSPPSESFDQSYLDALSNEGVDLDTFVRAWHQSLNDDLERMCTLRAGHDVAGLRGTLHRLSGAVGLVGACGLMESLRQASVTMPEPDADVLDAIARRIEALVTQLDEAIHPHRSN